MPNKQESHHTPPPPPPSSSEYNPICLAPKEQETQIKTSNRTNTFGTNKLNSSLLIVWGAQMQIHNIKRTNINKKREQILFFFVDCLGSTTCGFCWPRPQRQIISNTIKSRKLFRWKYVDCGNITKLNKKNQVCIFQMEICEIITKYYKIDSNTIKLRISQM